MTFQKLENNFKLEKFLNLFLGNVFNLINVKFNTNSVPNRPNCRMLQYDLIERTLPQLLVLFAFFTFFSWFPILRCLCNVMFD